MATKKASTKKPSKPAAPATCVTMKINANGTTTPKTVKLRDGECICFNTPDGFGADITMTITLQAGGGGGVVIHS